MKKNIISNSLNLFNNVKLSKEKTKVVKGGVAVDFIVIEEIAGF